MCPARRTSAKLKTPIHPPLSEHSRVSTTPPGVIDLPAARPARRARWRFAIHCTIVLAAAFCGFAVGYGVGYYEATEFFEAKREAEVMMSIHGQ
jgi:hypothetical protein